MIVARGLIEADVKKIEPKEILALLWCYSTVTDFARLRGISTLHPRITAIW